MTLFPDEQELISSNGNQVVLTDQRVYMNNKSWGQAYHITLFLEDISSVRLRYTSNTAWIIIAVVCLLYSLLAISLSDSANPFTLPAVVLGLACLILWWFSRKHIVSIHPHGGRPLEFQVSGVPGLQIDNFLHKLQWAKAQRVNKLYQ